MQARPGRSTSAPGALLALLSLLFGALHFVRLPQQDLQQQDLRTRTWARARLLTLRVLAAALSPVWAAFGLIGALAGIRSRRPLITATGLAGLWASAVYIRRVVAVTPPALPGTPVRPRNASRVTRDLVFHNATSPRSLGAGDRPVYCDLWQPAVAAPRSGIAIVYLHGSAWYLGDKAQLTDSLLGGWAGQGHVVMDVAYRMCPETDLRGMLADAWAAVAWLKAHAAEYGIDPDKVVLSGTSAGGHVALLAAYTAARADLTPPAMPGRDVSVRGVVAMSAPVDMAAMLDYHQGLIDSAHPGPGLAYDPLVDLDPLVPPGPGANLRDRTRWQRAQERRLAGLLRDLLGGGPDDAPEMFEFATVKSHIRPGLPPTLLIQGDQDLLVPVAPTRELYRDLQAAGVRTAYLELPLTDHGFELALPQISPPARAANAAITRFLAEL